MKHADLVDVDYPSIGRKPEANLGQFVEIGQGQAAVGL